MITNIPLQLCVLWASILSWINISSPLILFGLYYGFLTTLPIGPSQILSIRAFLLEGNLSGIIAISGLILGQSIIFSSIYYSPFYIILIKPHTITLLVLPYVLFYWYRIKDLLDYQSLRSINSINDFRIYKNFFDSFIFQILNPVLLPSPVLVRLVNLFSFRYSNNLIFVSSCFFGWLIGHLFFLNFLKILLIRIEQDSPILYLLIKRIIHRTFSIFILAYFLIYLGRAPVPIFTKKLSDEFQFNKQLKTYRFSWLNKPWPSLFFDYSRWNRPLRYIENGRFSNKSLVKKKVSQYFFDISINNGKQKLSFTALPSLSIFEKNLINSLNISKKSVLSNNLYKDWIDMKKVRKDTLYDELKNRLKALDNGFFVKNVIERKTGLSNNEGENLIKHNDPFLNGSFRGKIIISKSPWLLIENLYESKKKKKISYLLTKENKLKFWISSRWKELEQKNFPLPWEPLNKDARRILILLIRGSKNKKLETKLQQINISEEQIFINSDKQSTFSELVGKSDNKIFLKKKLTRTSYFNWELVLNLSTRQRALYFRQLEQEKWQILERSWKNIWSNNLSNFNNINKLLFLLKRNFYFNKKLRLQEISKKMPRWTSKLRNDKFDVIAGGVTDIRQRKVKNLGYIIKGKDKRRKIVRRFSQQSDFRRKLVKGSMRARRRKTLIWKILQLKTHSPFFLRINEKHIPFQFSSNKFNIFNLKNIFKNPMEKRKQITLFSTKNKIFLKKTKSDRLAIANRWDFPLAQWGRSWLLIIQSYFRKYLVLTILIISKNIIRLILFQTTEWGQDWDEWKKEIYIKCTYDGTEVSEKELPEQWLRDGLQIKIIYPFSLKPWHSLHFKRTKEKKILNSLEDEKKFSNNLLDTDKNFIKDEKKKINYSYLTAWGFETNAPFGDLKKKSSFWKPIRKKLVKKWKKSILIKFNKIYLNFLFINKKFIINSVNPKLIGDKSKIRNLDTKINNHSEFISDHDKINQNRKEKIILEFNKNILSENQIKNESKTFMKIERLRKLRDLKKYKIKKITKKTHFDKIKFSNKLENQEKVYVNNKKKIIESIYQVVQYCKKTIEIKTKWSYLIKIKFNKIKKNVFNLYIYFIRFNINLILKMKQNLMIKNWNLSKNYQIDYKKDKIYYEYTNNFNQENILLMSQAYLSHKIWQIKTRNEYNFKALLKRWTLNLIPKEKIKNDLKKNNFTVIKFENLKKEHLKILLEKFNRYNISSQIWYTIMPEEWKNKVTYQWINKRKKKFRISEKQTKLSIFSKEKNFSYKLITNSLLEQKKKLNKRYQYNYFCYNYLDFEKTFDSIKSTKNKDNETISQKLKNKLNSNIKSNLVLWLIPLSIKEKYINTKNKIDIPKISLLKQKNEKNIRNKKSLRERERYQTIRQWKWKSKNIEKKFKELGDMASLMTFMQDQENIISLSAKMRENLNLFRLLFCRDLGINKLTINSEHRIPRVLDDEILMYKVVSIFLKSKVRFKNSLTFLNLNESTYQMNFFQNDINKNFKLVNLEDILLLKHRKELKVLNLLYLNKSETSDLDRKIVKTNEEKLIKLQKIQNENQNLIIKHFIWPSFRLEDLACVNRFWFNTNNGSRFTMLRIRMYSQNNY